MIYGANKLYALIEQFNLRKIYILGFTLACTIPLKVCDENDRKLKTTGSYLIQDYYKEMS